MIRFVTTITPAPLPSDDAVWAGVTIISGGLWPTPTTGAVLAHWEKQGVPFEDATALLSCAQSDVILTVETAFTLQDRAPRRYALTARAADDVRRAEER